MAAGHTFPVTHGTPRDERTDGAPFGATTLRGAKAGAIAGNGRRQTETVGDRVCSPSEMTAETRCDPAIRPCVHWGSRGPGFKSRQPDKKSAVQGATASGNGSVGRLRCNHRATRPFGIDIPSE